MGGGIRRKEKEVFKRLLRHLFENGKALTALLRLVEKKAKNGNDVSSLF